MTANVAVRLAAGHRRYGYVGAAGDEDWRRERLGAFRARPAEHGLLVARNAVVQSTEPTPTSSGNLVPTEIVRGGSA